MKRMRMKAIVSCLMLLLLLLLFVSGGMLYFGKTGLILGFSRAFLLNLHALCALSLTPLVIIHMGLNFRMFKNELKKLFKRGNS